MTVPSFSQCVIGYRCWKILDWVLAPQSVGDPWRPGVNSATCKVPDMSGTFGIITSFYGFRPPRNLSVRRHEAPHGACTCGIYARHVPPGQWPGAGQAPPSLLRRGLVAGAIAAWGTLEVHTDGFRAQHAQIVALAGDPQKLATVAAVYDVPVVAPEQLEREALRHGMPLPTSVIPDKLWDEWDPAAS